MTFANTRKNRYVTLTYIPSLLHFQSTFLQESYLSKRLEELREELAANHRSVIDAMQAKFEEERQELKSQQEVLLQQSLQEERAKLESEKEMELKTLSEKLRKKAKIEIEGLRSRFRMMQMVQSNAGQDRSPSASESELSIGVSVPLKNIQCISLSVATFDLSYSNFHFSTLLFALGNL